MMLVPRKNYYTDLWDTMFSDPFFTRETNYMKTDIKEEEGQYTISIDMPGFEKDQITIEAENGYLSVKADVDTNNDEKDEKGNFIRQERYHGSMSRSYFVGDKVKMEDITANFKNGILSISIPKPEIQQPVKKTICIE